MTEGISESRASVAVTGLRSAGTMDGAAYFDPRLRIITPAARRRDAAPIDALDQMFGYFDALA